MPEPQTGTPTVVATEGDTCIRLGIGSHSLGTPQTRVKSRCGNGAAEPLPSRPEATTLPASMRAPVASSKLLAAIFAVAIFPRPS